MGGGSVAVGDAAAGGADVDGSEQVRAFWRGLGLPGLVDVHTHFMPERVMAKVWAYFDAAGPLVGRPWPIAYRLAEEERLAVLRGFGVRAFTSMIYPHKPGMAVWLNGWAAGFAARTPDCLRTATFFPEGGAAAYVRAELAGGARVFKAHVQVGGYDPAGPLLDPVWGALAEAGTPVVIHCGSGPVPARYTGPEPVARLLARHPRLRLVIAHLGMPEYVEFLDLAERWPGVHLDTTNGLHRLLRAGRAVPARRNRPARGPRAFRLDLRGVAGSGAHACAGCHAVPHGDSLTGRSNRRDFEWVHVVAESGYVAVSTCDEPDVTQVDR
jgi:hypothetical protein